jgi:hypothetical protein
MTALYSRGASTFLEDVDCTQYDGGMGTVKFEPDQTSSIPVNLILTMIELPRFDHIYFLLA